MKLLFFLIFLLLNMNSSCQNNSHMDCKKLTPEEKYVIENKGTERAFSGKYYKFDELGVYVCKKCGAKLYNSENKFESGSGWPSFDSPIKGAVKEIPDKDGIRTEIVCVNCGGHLGHVFYGEGFTEKNARHCVNSISLDFNKVDSTEIAVFAGGCFWGVEYYFENLDGVISTDVGYTGGNTENPSYKDVCYNNTGHSEAIRIVFNPKKVSYEELARLFFEIHDPTTIDRQGPDVGNQYRSVIFYLSETQKTISENLISELKSKGYNVVTQLVPLKKFYIAEEYHQSYYMKKGSLPYCHKKEDRFNLH